MQLRQACVHSPRRGIPVAPTVCAGVFVLHLPREHLVVQLLGLSALASGSHGPVPHTVPSLRHWDTVNL